MGERDQVAAEPHPLPALHTVGQSSRVESPRRQPCRPNRGASPPSSASSDASRGHAKAGWVVQHRDKVNLSAGPGIAIREFRLTDGGYADYLLFVQGAAVGVLEAKPGGPTLAGVEPQIQRYAPGLPANLHAPVRPLPFLYLSTGTDTRFINLLDPDPRTRRLILRPSPSG